MNSTTTATNAETSHPLNFGSSQWQLDSTSIRRLKRLPTAILDLNESIDSALRQPIGIDGLDQLIVSGDTVALAVDPTLPDLLQLVPALCRWLVEHTTLASCIQVVIPVSEQLAEALVESLRKNGLDEVQVIRHDLDDVNSVSYVAADDEAQAIYISRALVDADVVIPVSRMRSPQSLDYLGAFSTFPLFSNRETFGNLNSALRLSDPEQHLGLVQRTDQAAWWLGVMVAIQVEPTARNQVASVLCGLLESVNEAAVARTSAQPLPSTECDLIVACLDRTVPEWSDLARAIHAALKYCTHGGSIVLCTELSAPVGPALRRLREAQVDRSQIAKKVSKDSSDDALVAGVILEATRDHHLYLVSKHRSSTVENLGMAVLSDQMQLAQLAKQFSNIGILDSAEFD